MDERETTKVPEGASPDHAVTVLRTSRPVSRLSVRMRHSTPAPLLRTYLSWAYRKSRSFLLGYSLSLAGVVVTVIGGSAQTAILTVLGVAITIAGALQAFVAWYRSIKDLQLRRLDDYGNALSVHDQLVDSGYTVELK